MKLTIEQAKKKAKLVLSKRVNQAKVNRITGKIV